MVTFVKFTVRSIMVACVKFKEGVVVIMLENEVVRFEMRTMQYT